MGAEGAEKNSFQFEGGSSSQIAWCIVDVMLMMVVVVMMMNMLYTDADAESQAKRGACHTRLPGALFM